MSTPSQQTGNWSPIASEYAALVAEGTSASNRDFPSQASIPLVVVPPLEAAVVSSYSPDYQ
jgi:hypothetical protein